MADNFETNAGSGGKTFKSDQISSIDIPASKITLGADGTDDGYISSANPMPVTTRAATTDNIGSALMTNVIHNGVTALTPKFAAIDASNSGNNTLVAAVADKKIRILALILVSAGAVNVRLEDGAGGSAITGQMNLTTNSGFTLPFSPVGWGETSSNTLLNLELSDAISVDGCLVYVEV